MIAEVVRTFRSLKRPFRSEYWRRKRIRKKGLDQPGVLMLSFSQLTEKDRQRLRKTFSAHQIQKLSNESLPPLPISEHGEPDSWWLACYRIFFFLIRTFRELPALLLHHTSLSRHLLETDDLARTRYGLEEGQDFLHLASLQSKVVVHTRQLKRFISALESRRYEIWWVDRERKECHLPASLVLPGLPITAEELVEIARAYLCPRSRPGKVKKHERSPGCIRIMTYNLHSCIGLDGRASVQRIADVLERYQPDFVALQELDVGCARSGHQDQLNALRELWPSEGAFFPLVGMSGGSYGIGFLSRLPVERWEGTILPQPRQSLPQEPRAVLEVEVRPPGWNETLKIWNTHLGLTRKERLAHLEGITDLASSSEVGHEILIGDFNCSPKSPEYKTVLEDWQPTQAEPAKTWFGTFPLRHLDYCFFRGSLEVEACWAPRDSHTRLASDHLPLIVDFKPLKKPR